MGRALVWIGGILGGVGLLFVAIAGWLYLRDSSFAEGAVHAQGTVVEMAASSDSDGYSYTPVVEFRDADGSPHRFASSVSSNPPRYSTGETVAVIYPPDAPDNAKIDEFLERFFLVAVFGGLGTLFSAIGGGLLFHVVRKNRIAGQLRASGMPIQAKVTEFYLDTSLTVNGRNPWRVVCQAVHPATGQMQSFRSEALWAYPNTDLAGREVRVFVDPAHPDRHLVDMTPYVDEGAIG
jgi:hypothetical protein